jgi:diadenosine tetraphosphate (Ap4A) HIT family hydrolase
VSVPRLGARDRECLACDLTRGARPLPGGVIREIRHWRLEHCVGPLGVGTLIVKPKRHVERVAELERDEAVELGPFMVEAAAVAAALTPSEQVYVTLWSAGPVHIHWVVQPITYELIRKYGLRGPALQAAMFEANEFPDPVEVDTLAAAAREWFAGR